MILIYNDAGASAESVHALVTLLSDDNTIKCVSGAEIRDKNTFKKVRCFIMPGGRSLPFYEKCGHIGNAAIIDFVKRGGLYVGLCAGAYYAAKETIFAEKLPLSLHLPGELNFFEGRAIGPVFSAKQFAYQSESGALSVSISFKNADKYTAYFNGGCYFEKPEAFKNTQILATYTKNQKAAIIKCAIGKGHAILSGVHPELSDNKAAQKLIVSLITLNR